VFRSSGFGHGLGLCQEGAHEMARLGFSSSQIIDHYFPGTLVAAYALDGTSARPALDFAGSLPQGFVFQPAAFPIRHGIAAGGDGRTGSSSLSRRLRRQTVSSEHFSARFDSSVSMKDIEAMLATAEAARGDLLERLNRASVSVIESKLLFVVNGTTQDFMAATGQPWWAAAATRGTTIELQPLATLKRKGILGTTIRHEYAHYVIDRLSGGKAPRWLAEGLAAHFAGEAAMLANYQSHKTLTTDEIEQRLGHAASPAEMRSLYAASLRAVEEFIRANGESAVWILVAGGWFVNA